MALAHGERLPGSVAVGRKASLGATPAKRHVGPLPTPVTCPAALSLSAKQRGRTSHSRCPFMSYATHWRNVAALIKGLQRAGEIYSQFQTTQREDSHGAGSYLHQQCAAAVRTLRAFRDDFAGSLPSGALQQIDHFLSSTPAQAAGDLSTVERGMRAALVSLGALEAKVTFILSERAFIHLQRTLAVDEQVRAKWMDAFERHETVCERLGSVHLLSHGIFAFKVDAAGARTDLVFPEIPEDALLAGVFEGFVLTEWKRAKDANGAAHAFREARAQTDLYRQGPLVGVELTGYRYLVVVSRRQLTVPLDSRAETGVVYRHINIAVEPSDPSVAATKLSRTRKKPRNVT
jgi:hypothetical protein